VSVLVFVEGGDDLSRQALTLGESLGDVDVVSFDGPYAPSAWAAAIVERAGGAQAIVGPGSDRGNEVLAHVAAQLDLPFAANVTEVRGDELTRVRWGGSLLEDSRLQADLKLLTAAPFAFEASSSDLETEVLHPELGDAPRVL